MKNNSTLTGVVLLLCCLASFIIPTLSWLLSALGLQVNSILSDEGWRWLFHSGIDYMFTYPVALLLCIITCYGCYKYADLRINRLSLRNTLLLVSIGGILLLPIIIAAVHPRSPLVSLTGALIPSPWLYGLPFALCIEFMVLMFVYLLFTRRNFSFSNFGSYMAYGLSHYGAWVFVASMLSFIYHCILYMYGLVTP